MTKTPAQLDKRGRSYLPKSFKRQSLAPTQPGDYEFVCTFPGHAVLMWGTLSVSK